jgi:hypothetical protein
MCVCWRQTPNQKSTKYYIHVVLTQNIKKLFSQINVSLYYTLKEYNQCANLFSILEASSDADFLTYTYIPKDVHDFFKNNTMRIFFLCNFFFLVFFWFHFNFLKKKCIMFCFLKYFLMQMA